MLAAATVAVVLCVLAYTLLVREKDLPPPAPVSPFEYLDERKARIYENLRDLQFELRLGKLSDDDYQKSKLQLQTELAQVLAEVDALKEKLGVATKPVTKQRADAQKSDSLVCPHCKARMPKPMKFCGECGKAMSA